MRAPYQVADVLNMEVHRLGELCLTSWHSRALHAIRKCRTPALGGHIDQCNCCSKLHISYNSCRNRHCPTCQGHKQKQWVEKRMEELLPVGYFHVVFTLPSELNSICLRHSAELYKILFDTAWATMESFGKTELQAHMGMIAILHTWGQNLSLHPHLHCIVPGGGLTQSGKWKSAKNKGKFLFPVKGMSKMFRAKFVALMRKRVPEIPQIVYDSLFKKQWVIYAKPPFSKPHNVVEYLGRYTHKIAISNHRITQIDKEKREVTFNMKDYRHGGINKQMKLSTEEFIRRFNLHILPKGFTRIRHYGILSSSWKREKLPNLQLLLGGENYLENLQKNTKEILLNRCPSCKKGTLITIHTFGTRGPPKKYSHLQDQIC